MNLCKLIIAAAELVFAENFSLEVPDDFNSDVETDGNEGGKTYKPAAPGYQSSQDYVLVVVDIAFTCAVKLKSDSIAESTQLKYKYAMNVVPIWNMNILMKYLLR